MEILFATNLRPWGGGENWMLSTAKGLRARGHGVSLAAAAESEIAARARDAGIDVLECPFTRDVDPTSFFRVLWHCRTRRVEVLCLNMDRVLRIAGNAARLAGVRAVWPRRGSDFALKGHLNYRYHYGVVASGVIVNSQATRDSLCRDISWRPKRVELLYNGLDLAPYDPERLAPRAATRAGLGLADDALVLINVGELTTRKNAALLVRALPRLPENVHAVLVGEGPEREPLQQLASELDVAARVHLLGFRDDVPSLIAASDLLVHCAHVEGFGFAVAEAGAARIPAVAAATSSVPEIVEHGVTGRLYADDDVDDLVANLEPYLRDPNERARHGEAGRARVEANFELEAQLTRLEEIFRSSL